MDLILSNGKVCKVDESDYLILSKYNWYHSSVGYARSIIGGKYIYMHRFILAVSDSDVNVDHINMDKLDNRRSNLRLVTKSQNAHNSLSKKKKYKGVFKHRRGGYYSQICVNGVVYHCGYFMNEIDAAKSYNKFAIRLVGEYARLNII